MKMLSSLHSHCKISRVYLQNQIRYFSISKNNITSTELKNNGKS